MVDYSNGGETGGVRNFNYLNQKKRSSFSNDYCIVRKSSRIYPLTTKVKSQKIPTDTWFFVNCNIQIPPLLLLCYFNGYLFRSNQKSKQNMDQGFNTLFPRILVGKVWEIIGCTQSFCSGVLNLIRATQ